VYTPEHTAVQDAPPPAVSMHTNTGERMFPVAAMSYVALLSKLSMLGKLKALLFEEATTPAFSLRNIFLSLAMIDCTSRPLFLSFFQWGTSWAMCGHSIKPAFRQASHIKLTLMLLNMLSPFSYFMFII
jgi:hypothetical protein